MNRLAAIQFPLPDIDPDKPNYGLGNLGAYRITDPGTPYNAPAPSPADTIADLQGKLVKAQADQQYWSSQAAYYGSFPPRDETLRPMAEANSKAREAGLAIGELTAQLAKEQAKVTNSQTTAQAAASAPDSPASVAQGTRDYLNQYVSQVALLKMGGFYDFGAGSAARNASYKSAGLGGLMLSYDCDSVDGLGDLGLDLFEAAKAAFSDPAAKAEFSKITSPFSGMGGGPSGASSKVKLPGGVTAFFSGLAKAGKAVASNIKGQKTNEPVAAGQTLPNASSSTFPVVASSNAKAVLILLALAAGGYIILKGRKK